MSLILLRSPCSIFHQFIPFWVAWWVNVFNWSPCSLKLQFAVSGKIDFCLVLPGLSDVVEGGTSGVFSLLRETKFIIGFDFAVTLSSPESFCVLLHHFKTISGTELADVEQTQKMIRIHHVWVFPLSVCLWVSFWCQCIWFGSWESKLIRSNNQSRATLSVLETWLSVGLLPLWSSWSLLCCPQTHTTKLPDEKIGRLRNKVKIIQNTEHSSRLLSFVNSERWRTSFTFVQHAVLSGSESCSQEQKQSNPITREQAARLVSIQRPKRWFRILLNCVKRQFVSCTSNLLEQVYDFQKGTMFHQK